MPPGPVLRCGCPGAPRAGSDLPRRPRWPRPSANGGADAAPSAEDAASSTGSDSGSSGVALTMTVGVVLAGGGNDSAAVDPEDDVAASASARAVGLGLENRTAATTTASTKKPSDIRPTATLLARVEGSSIAALACAARTAGTGA